MLLEPGPIQPIDAAAIARFLAPSSPLDVPADVAVGLAELPAHIAALDQVYATLATEPPADVADLDERELFDVLVASDLVSRDADAGQDWDVLANDAIGDSELAGLEAVVADEGEPEPWESAPVPDGYVPAHITF